MRAKGRKIHALLIPLWREEDCRNVSDRLNYSVKLQEIECTGDVCKKKSQLK